MNTRIMRGKMAVKVMSTVALGAAAVALLPALPAQALGNNRNVNRSCGVNYVASGSYDEDTAWAQTTKVSGNCSGSLGVSLKTYGGYIYPRVNGSSTYAYISKSNNERFSVGMHWGCLDCNVTYS
jgi:hypothetical protein